MAEFLPVDPFDLVIFGGTGDLARRKLMPSLFHRDRDGQFSADSRIVTVSRSDFGRSAYLDWLKETLAEHVVAAEPNDGVWERFARRVSHVCLDVGNGDDWQALSNALDDSGERIRVFYLATAPVLFGAIA